MKKGEEAFSKSLRLDRSYQPLRNRYYEDG